MASSAAADELSQSAGAPAWLRPLLTADLFLARIDRGVVAVALLASALAPTLSLVLRHLDLPSTPWLDLVPRYLTLVVGFVGAALVTRGGGHIALDLAQRVVPRPWVLWTRLGAESAAAVVAALLARAAWDFARFEREGGTLILNTLPSWIPALFLAWGFGLCAWRFWLRAGRLSVWGAWLVPMAGLVFLLAPAAGVMWLAGFGLVAGALAGMPLFATLGGLALFLFWREGAALSVVPIEIYRLVQAPALVTLPLFTLVGAVLAQGGAPARLVRLAQTWLGWLPGGLAIASVVLCAFFTTFTGASGVTILALGLLLHELLTHEGYGDHLAVGVVTASGSIGLLLPPALPLIVYGIVAEVEIDKMFAAGLVPGVLLTGSVLAYTLYAARWTGLRRHTFNARAALSALGRAGWEVMLPVMVLGLLVMGWASVVEAAAAGATWALVGALWVNKDVPTQAVPTVLAHSGALVGAVLVILGVALAFTYYLVDAQVPQAAVAWAQAHLESRWVFLLALNLLLLVVGCLLDIFSALVIFVPLVLPVAAAFGVHPVHLGIIFLANLEIGYLTPPVGMNLFLSAFRFSRPLHSLWRPVFPFVLALIAALLVITYVPSLSLWMFRE